MCINRRVLCINVYMNMCNNPYHNVSKCIINTGIFNYKNLCICIHIRMNVTIIFICIFVTYKCYLNIRVLCINVYMHMCHISYHYFSKYIGTDIFNSKNLYVYKRKNTMLIDNLWR